MTPTPLETLDGTIAVLIVADTPLLAALTAARFGRQWQRYIESVN